MIPNLNALVQEVREGRDQILQRLDSISALLVGIERNTRKEGE